MLRSIRFALVLLLPAFLACDDTDVLLPPTTPQDVSGVWVGSITPPLGSTSFGFGVSPGFDQVELVLTEHDDRTVTGVAALFERRTATSGFARAAAQAFEVGGSNAFPTVALTLRGGTAFHATELVYLRLRFLGGDRLDGHLFGGGFNEDRVRLRRSETHLISFR